MKKTILSYPFSKLSMLLVLLAFTACTTISSFDRYAYIQTTSLKVDALNIMDMARDSFALNEKNVTELKTNLQKMYEYEKNRPKNEITLKMWDVILNPNGHLLGGFIKRWKNEKTLNATFIEEEKKMVSDAFDQIAGLESHKIKTAKP